MMEHAEHSPAAIREKAAGAVNCQSVTLPSGLTVLCRTMPGYSSVHAMYATNFGSVVREFTLNGKRIQLPAGTAHFLEHKMFENEDGDAFLKYAKIKKLLYKAAKTTGTAAKKLMPGTVRHSFHNPVFGSPPSSECAPYALQIRPRSTPAE